MKIISFSNAPLQPFWTVPVQALAPWISRIRNSLGQTAPLPAEHGISRALQTAFVPSRSAASNDAIFASGLQTPAPPRRSGSQAAPGKALRVVRESDLAIKPDCAGRMVISGRMADVCAELDRMTLRAAAVGTES